MVARVVVAREMVARVVVARVRVVGEGEGGERRVWVRMWCEIGGGGILIKTLRSVRTVL